VLRPGLHLGTFKKKRFAPSHSLATALNPDDFLCTIAVSDQEYRDYRHGLTISRPEQAGKFHVLLTNQGKGFAIGHLVNGTIKNMYPKGLRV
jgi:NOL1/NOP2/fmu family ribosome biogenesis protein